MTNSNPTRTSSRGLGLLQDKIVVVTGASQGIGKACVLAAANHGAHIVLHYLGDPKTTEDALIVQKQIERVDSNGEEKGRRKCVLVAGDISQEETAKKIVSTALAAFGRIDVLVSNAGICPFHEFLTMPTALWKKVQDVNLNGAFFICREVSNVMATQYSRDPSSQGSIVMISSISALMGGAGQTHYTPTKAALKSLMESCSIALAPLGIRCNSILPGTIATPINEEDLEGEKREDMLKRIPLHRFGTPEEIAEPVCFMASDMARYVTGASLLVDGGAAISLQ